MLPRYRQLNVENNSFAYLTCFLSVPNIKAATPVACQEKKRMLGHIFHAWAFVLGFR